MENELLIRNLAIYNFLRIQVCLHNIAFIFFRFSFSHDTSICAYLYANVSQREKLYSTMHVSFREKVIDKKAEKDISLAITDKCMTNSTGLDTANVAGKCSNEEDVKNSNKVIRLQER